ncbi:hypothetical protein FDW45_01920 [Campylobacter helveticus]|uniref:hypothetical protein n=1 Tax=Campylobacter helveticus TaxID=28898 RepID=UPI001117706F|nr:hypothetical protein [Campylobacter helveticus]TNH37079.1 hypothetical protein FDW45_01920 [Campylobacter helveticus]
MKNFNSNMGYIEFKKSKTTCSIQEIRLPIFAPIKKSTPSSTIYKDFVRNRRTRILKTQWGEVSIKGSLLTQVHKDILDLIVLFSSKMRLLEDKRLSISFSTSEILKNYGDIGHNYKWFKNILEELISAVIIIKDFNNTAYYFHIISAMLINEKGDFGGIILSKEYIEFYQKALAINYNKEIKNIVCIENSLIKSIVRFFLSHNEINITLDNLLLALGLQIQAKDRYFRKIKQELKQNVTLFAKFNIIYSWEKCNFIYQGNSNVNFFSSN